VTASIPAVVGFLRDRMTCQACHPGVGNDDDLVSKYSETHAFDSRVPERGLVGIGPPFTRQLTVCCGRTVLLSV
jgi:hypothetical protein